MAGDPLDNHVGQEATGVGDMKASPLNVDSDAAPQARASSDSGNPDHSRIEPDTSFDDESDADAKHEQTEIERNELLNLQLEIRNRCNAAKLRFDEPTFLGAGDPPLRIWLRAGRDERPVVIDSVKDANQLLALKFETLTVLKPYLAVCNYDEGTIQAAVAPSFAANQVASRLFGARDTSAVSLRASRDVDGAERTLSLSPPSSELLLLRPRASLALHISGYELRTFESATRVLEALADAFFLEVDIKCELTLSLTRDRVHSSRGRLGRNSWSPGTQDPFSFPRVEYDKEPMALYWYARQARGMPLLEFLAYYQSIEYYFPVYAESEARRRVRNVLKDPTFNPSREPDIARLVQLLTGRRGVSDERSQLRATLLECVDEDRLRDFFAEEEQIDFFAKDKTLGVDLLPLKSKGAVLRESVAERVYQLRCKVVHTKGGADEGQLLLPFSKEASVLWRDTQLLQFLARSVLVANSRLV